MHRHRDQTERLRRPPETVASDIDDQPNHLAGLFADGAPASRLDMPHVNGLTLLPPHRNGLSHLLNYDADGRLTGMSTATGSTQVPHLMLVCDAAANLTTITGNLVPAGSQPFGYDGTDRFTDASRAYAEREYTHAPAENRTRCPFDHGTIANGSLLGREFDVQDLGRIGRGFQAVAHESPPGTTAATAIRRLLDSAGVACEQAVVDAPSDAYVLITTETLVVYAYVDGEIQIETRGGFSRRLELADFSSPAELLRNALLHVEDQLEPRTVIARGLNLLRSGWLASYLMVSTLAIVLQVFDPWTGLSGIGALWVVALLFSRSVRRGRTSAAHAQR